MSASAFDPGDRHALCDAFTRLLADRWTEGDLRRAMAADPGHDPTLWAEMAAMGITGLLVDSAFGGSGGGGAEIEAVMEVAGAALLAGPLLSSAVIAAVLLGQSSDEATQQRLLPGLAKGERIFAVALTGEAGCWTAETVDVAAVEEHGSWHLSGCASFVLSGSVADVILVAAQTPQGLAVFEVDPGACGLQVCGLTAFDPSLRLSRMTFEATPAVCLPGLGQRAFEQALDAARVALAGEQAGACRRVFEMTLDYLKTRVQFGRPIGGFQAMKHMAADLLIEVEGAVSAARSAAAALDGGRSDARRLVSLASFACADAFERVAAQAIQMHGGIAFTWEHSAHLYWRRARANAQLFGASDVMRERYLAAVETGA